jgi:hypothetical protein
MSVTRLTKCFGFAALAGAVLGAAPASAAIIVFDDFNTDEGHFAQAPTFSGSTTGIATTSTADRITSDTFEGAGSEQLVLLDDATAGGSSRVRFLSGGGTAANNLSFTTSAGTDGWIGLALKTTAPGWNVQIWIEGAENNGSIPKNIADDGLWHIYQWNLDDQTGGADGWGAVAGIVAGDADVQDGSYTIDSVLFRNTAMAASSTILMDWVVRDNAGRIVPEPAALAMLGLAGLALAAVRRRCG